MHHFWRVIQPSDILYVEPNKKRTNNWLRAFGLQLPVSLSQYGSISNVTYSDDFVNDVADDFGKGTFAEAFEKAGIKTTKQQLSLSEAGQEILPIGNYNVYGKDISLPEAEILPPPVNREVAPVQQDVESDDLSQYVEPYSEHQKNNWKNSKKIVLYESKEQLRNFIEDAKERKNAGKKLYFGKVKPELVERVQRELNYDIEGYNCALYSDNIKKIFKDHGDELGEAERGQRAVQTEDFFAIPEVISAPDTIKAAGEYNGQPVIHFKKNGITVVGVITEGALDLYPQTMYISKKIEALQRRQMNKPLSIRPRRHEVQLL